MDKEQLDLWDRLDDEYRGLCDGVMIEREALGQAVVDHSEDHRRASENWVYAKRVLAYAIREKATVWATTCTRLREDQTDAFNSEAKGPKVTDKSVENAARGDGSYLDAAFQLSEVEQLVGLYEELSKRYHGRGFRLRDLVTLHQTGRDRDYIKDEPTRLQPRAYYGSERESDDESRDETETEAPADTETDAPTRRRRFGAIK